MEDLSAKLTTLRPKAFFTQSLAHNPTGNSLSTVGAFGLLQAAQRWGFQLVEDDAFADVLAPTLPRLAAFEHLDRVIYVGTFSKTLSASLRSGFVAGRPSIIGALSDIKLVTTVATSDYVERFIFSLIQGGQYLRHLRRLRARLEEANKLALSELEAVGLRVTGSKVPGFYLWAELPEQVDELELCRAAASESIFLAPGQVFRPNRAAARPGAMRVNVAYGADPGSSPLCGGPSRNEGAINHRCSKATELWPLERRRFSTNCGCFSIEHRVSKAQNSWAEAAALRR